MANLVGARDVLQFDTKSTAYLMAISFPMYALRWFVEPTHLDIANTLDATATATRSLRAEALVQYGKQYAESNDLAAKSTALSLLCMQTSSPVDHGGRQ
jgi:hypothetical protein